MLAGALVIISVALVISFTCSLLEACVLSLSKAEVAAFGEISPRLARIWTGFKNDLQYPLSIILIINTCSHTIGASLAAARFEHLYGQTGVVVSSALLSFVMIQWTEVLPKTLGSRRRRKVAQLFGVPLHLAVVVLRPLARLVRLLNRPFEGSTFQEPPTSVEEIRALARQASTAKVIDSHQDEIIGRAAALARVSATSIMVFRDEVSRISTAMTLEEAIAHAHVDEHTRYPLCVDGDLDRVVGYINLKELVAAVHANSDTTLRMIARPMSSVSAERDGASILREFVDKHVHLAVVRDADGRTLGLITMEDLIEELVGELEDEFDALPRRIHEFGTGLLVGGGVKADDVFRRLGLVPPQSWAGGTIAAWIASKLPGRPKSGDVVTTDTAQFVVRRIRRGKVFEAAVQIRAATPKT